MKDRCCTREVFVDVCAGCEIFDEKVERGIFEQSSCGGFEKLMKLVATNVDAKLPCVIAVCVSDVVLQLVRVSHLVLRQIHAQSDRSARGGGIELS